MIKNNCCFISKTKINPSFSTSLSFTYIRWFITSNKQEFSINNTITCNIEAISWFNIDENGFIIISNGVKKIENRPGIYIYINKIHKNQIYIGSSINVAKRLISHKNSFNKNLKICPKFYNSVNKYGWNNFKVGVLEYMDLSISAGGINKDILRKSILNREQFYFDLINPTLNVNKIAGSTLGFRHSQETRLTMGLNRKGKSINWLRQDSSYIISEETRKNLSLRCRHGVIVKVLDNDNNIINIFPSIVSTANFYGLDHNTISKYIKNESYFKNLRFVAELKDVRIWVFDKERRLAGVFSNAQKAAKFCNTNHTALSRYLKSGKLWKNKYYFSRESGVVS